MRLRAFPAEHVRGSTTVPGDKSVSHRALMLAALAVGESRIGGLLEGADVLATADALRALGADIHRDTHGTWHVAGLGVGGLREPDRQLDLGNAGTGARLLLGILAGQPFTSFVTGDDSLRNRPMARVTEPLSQMGATFLTRSGGRLPLAITGSSLIPIRYEQRVASAQVKSAILLAGLHAPGRTSVVEPSASRDHTERMLRHLGATVTAEPLGDGRQEVSVIGEPELEASVFEVPGCASSAAFPIVAAALIQGSSLRIDGLGVNPLRTGLMETLREMGARLGHGETLDVGGEPVASLRIEAAPLAGVDVPAERAPRMIDEYPILAVAAACARGSTTMRGLAELRVKESDRLAVMADGLAACGVGVQVGEDSLTVQGCDGAPAGGAIIDAHHDHRIAMSFLVLGSVAREPVTVEGAETIETSFPDFAGFMNRLGARIEEAD
ncbi:MAG: 3-phosphoshikimate 1-carboxyvinyltransferase [Pseudomonadota bacterium]